jgi:hypothetical protein
MKATRRGDPDHAMRMGGTDRGHTISEKKSGSSGAIAKGMAGQRLCRLAWAHRGNEWQINSDRLRVEPAPPV